MQRLLATFALAAVAMAAAGCGSTSAAQPASLGPVDPNAPVVVAKGLVFTTPQISAPAGKAFQLSFDNEDGAPHNVAIYTDSSASHALFQGEIFGGTATRVYDVPALEPGSYFFRCDVHPDMQGSIVVQ